MRHLVIMEVAQVIAIYKRNAPWLLIVIAIILYCSIRCRAEETGKEVTYLNVMDMQLQMCDLFKAEGKIYRSNKLLAICEEQKADTFEQVFISTEDFVVINNIDDQVIVPNWKIGNLYVYQAVVDGSGELYAIQGAKKINTAYDTIVDNLSAYFQIEPIAIEPLEDMSDVGSTKTEIASEIEPFNEYPSPLVDESSLGSNEAGEDISVDDPVEELDQNDVVQDPVEVSAEEQIETESQELPEGQIEEESVPVEVSAEDPAQDPKEETKNETDKNISVSGTDTNNADHDLDSTNQALYSYIAPAQVEPAKATATYTDTMEGSPVIKSTNKTTQSSEASTVKSYETVDESKASDSGNAENSSTARTAIDGEEVVDDVTLHNDNFALQIGLWAVGGIAAAMMIVRLML